MILNRNFRRLLILLAVTVLTFFVLGNASPAFVSPNNISNILRNSSFIGIIALGQTVLIISGGIDLAVGSTMALSAVILGTLLQLGMPVYLSITIALFAAVIIGIFHWIFVHFLRVSPFIVTLASMSIGRSLAIVISGNQTLYELGESGALLEDFVGGYHLGISNITHIFLILAVITTAISTCAPVGRHVYAIGGNEDAIRKVGLSAARLKFFTYTFSSLCAGISAVLTVGFMGSVTSATGTGTELSAIAAAVIGGASLSGGVGSPLGAIFGAVIMELIRNALVIFGVNPFLQGCFVGSFILIAVIVTRGTHSTKE